MPVKTVNISFHPDLLKAIDRAAEKESRSRSEFLREAARAYIHRRQRWEDLFALGRKIARSRDLAPEDVGDEIRAHRAGQATR